MPGETVNKGELSRIFDMSIHGIDSAVARGAPHVKGRTKKDGYRFNTAEFLQWCIEDKVANMDPFIIAKTESMNTAVKIKRRELAALEATTLTVDEAMALYRNEAAIIRKHVLAIPGRVAAQFAAASDASAIEALVMDEVNLALSKIVEDDSSDGD